MNINDKLILNNLLAALKESLGVKYDKEIAVKLDLSAQDFSARKKRGTLLPLINQYIKDNNITINGSPPDENGHAGSQSNTHDIKIHLMLSKVSEILESKTIYRAALAHNINAFFQAIKNDERIADMELRLDKMEEYEKQFKDILNELAQKIKDLQEENRILKQSRSSGEEPAIVVASSDIAQASDRKTK